MNGRKGVYGIVYQNVLRSSELSPESKAIYGYLASFAGCKNTCFPSRKMMLKELQMSETRFSKHMNPLIALGVVSVTRERNGNVYGKNIYTINHEIQIIENQDSRCSENESAENESAENLSTNSNSINIKNINNKNINNKEHKDIVEKNLDKPPYKEIIDYLNAKTNKSYQYQGTSTQRHINGRFKEGYTLDDFKKVIDIKTAEWKEGKMEQYLRPETLFGTKFEGYLNQQQGEEEKENGIKTGESTADFYFRKYGTRLN
jgi:uncharacterized phage protein (TIGR02220 family)